MVVGGGQQQSALASPNISIRHDDRGSGAKNETEQEGEKKQKFISGKKKRD